MDFYERTEKTLSMIDRKVSEMSVKMKLGYKLDPENIFFDNQEFLQIMNISKKTAMVWRQKDIIKFSNVGNKYYYRLKDILKLLEENYNPKKEL
jgi:hypothetical protein